MIHAPLILSAVSFVKFSSLLGFYPTENCKFYSYLCHNMSKISSSDNEDGGMSGIEPEDFLFPCPLPCGAIPLYITKQVREYKKLEGFRIEPCFFFFLACSAFLASSFLSSLGMHLTSFTL